MMYDELIEELRRHHCDAKEDDTQEVCEECAYDVIIAGKSAPSGIASVCVCGLMNRAADAIERLDAIAQTYVETVHEIEDKRKWIPVTERLPDVEEVVLCFCRANIFFVLSWDGYHWHEGADRYYMSSFVTHWMPLPQPPESEGE